MSDNNQKTTQGQYKKNYQNKDQKDNINNPIQSQNQQSTSFQNNQTRAKQENNERNYENNIKTQTNQKADNQMNPSQQVKQTQNSQQSNQYKTIDSNNQQPKFEKNNHQKNQNQQQNKQYQTNNQSAQYPNTFQGQQSDFNLDTDSLNDLKSHDNKQNYKKQFHQNQNQAKNQFIQNQNELPKVIKQYDQINQQQKNEQNDQDQPIQSNQKKPKDNNQQKYNKKPHKDYQNCQIQSIQQTQNEAINQPIQNPNIKQYPHQNQNIANDQLIQIPNELKNMNNQNYMNTPQYDQTNSQQQNDQKYGYSNQNELIKAINQNQMNRLQQDKINQPQQNDQDQSIQFKQKKQQDYNKKSDKDNQNLKMQSNQQRQNNSNNQPIQNPNINTCSQNQMNTLQTDEMNFYQQNDQIQCQLNQASEKLPSDNKHQNRDKKSNHNKHNNKRQQPQQDQNNGNDQLIQNPNQLKNDNKQNYMNTLQYDQTNQQQQNDQKQGKQNQAKQKKPNDDIKKQTNKHQHHQKKQKFQNEQSDFVKSFFKNHLGLEQKNFNNYSYYEFERLAMFKSLDNQLQRQFKQQIQQTIKFIADWVQGNQSLIEKNQNNEEVFKQIKIFTSYFIELTKKFDQSLIQNYEKLLNNQNLDDYLNQMDQLDILNKKQKQEDENQDILDDILDLQNFLENQRNQKDEYKNFETMSQKTFGSTQFDQNSSNNTSFSLDQTDDLANSQSRKLNEEQLEDYKKFSLKLFRRFQKCLSIERAMNKRNLPAYYARQDIKYLLENCENPFILLMGSTGSGKTTQTPQVLYQHQLMDEKKANKVIYCVQPRKINCISISERVANEMGCKLGEEVGYQVGYSVSEQKFDRFKTKIIFITESLLMSMLVKQNKQKQKENKKDFFKHCSYIILDEVHERSVKSDIIMGLAKTIFSEQTNLKFFLSSATADRNLYQQYFQNLPIVEIPGKIYPVDEEFIAEQGTSVTKVIKHLNIVIDRIEQGVELHNGHILVFMMDGQEIDECIKQATSLPKLDLQKYKLLPLHSRLEKDQQELVFIEHFNDDNKQMKKIIFSTNIAETAITINNITIVIDCGMEKVAKFDPRKNITTIQSTFISKSSAKQRQGRAGRTCPGICYKLYSEEEYESFANEKIPEISRINIEQVLLQIIESGEKVETFPYFEKPDQNILKCSKDNLIRLGAIDKMNNSLTVIGRIMQKSDLEPYQIKCLIDAYKLNVINEVTNILAVMPEIGGLFKREEDQQQNNFYKKQSIKNEYNSDFLNYNQIFEKIKTLNKQDQSKKNLKENNIKYYVWTDILTNRYNLSRFVKRIESKHPEVLQNKMNNNQDKTEVRILKVMLNAYINQISIFSGIKYLGFIDMKSNIQFRIHPQSLYSRQNFDRGAILIYGNLEDREKSTYAKHISEIRLEWLNDQNLFSSEIYRGILQTKEEAQNNSYHYQIKASNFMIDQFRKLHLAKVQNKIMEYSEIYPKAKSFLILDTEQCLIKVASTKEGQTNFEQRQIGKYIEDLVKKERQIHRQKVIIRKFKESDNYAVIGEGYQIIDILLPNQFVKVKVANLPTKNEYGEEITKNYIEKQFKLSNNKEYYDLFIHKSEKSSYAQIQFLTYESAIKFVKDVNLDIMKNSKAITVVGIPESNIKNNLFEKFSLNVYIPIDKPTGVGYLNFQNELDRDQTLKYLQEQKFNASSSQRKENGSISYSIKLQNLKIEQNEEFLQKQVQQTYNGFINAKIERQKSQFFNSDLEQIELQYTYLRSYATSIVLKEDIPKIYINIESEKTSYLKAKICFPKREYCEKFQQDYSKEITENGPLKIYFNNILSFFVDKAIYKLLQNQYMQFKEQSTYKQIEFKEINSNDRLLIQIAIFKNELTQLLNQAFNQLKTLFKSQKLIFDIEYWQLDRIMNQQQQKIQQIQQQNKVIIQQNPKKSYLSVWLNEQNSIKRKTVLSKIENEIKSLFTGKKNIFLNNYKQTDQLIDFLEQKKTNHTFTFQKDQQKIILEGQLKLIFDIFKEVNQNFRKPFKDDIYCEICCEQKNLERLDQCGCIFCKECIGEYIVTSSSKFDTLCCPNHKDIPITLEDSYDIISSIEEDTIIEKKINDRIDGWKNLQNQLKFIRCPTANCDSFFGRVYKLRNGDYLDLSIPLNIRCSECYQQFCLLKTDANNKNSNIHEYHQGDCENYKDKQFIEQMLITEGGKYCPTCNIPIIKNQGCNHMTCKACQTHFCWNCVQVFDPKIIYNHMTTCQQPKKNS
ncbi:hypothetical protein ABPG74_018678 [Tetrahymena malaccensis]